MVSAINHIPPRYKECSFENYIPKDINQKKAKEAMQGMADGQIKENIIIHGNVGTGKTHLCYALTHQTSKECEYKYNFNTETKRYFCSEKTCFTTIKKIIDDIRTCWKDSADEFDRAKIDMYKTIPILIIDEIGVQYGTDSERIELYEIINTRYENMLPIVCCTNLNKEQIKKCIGLRSWDRLSGGATIIELSGESYRQKTIDD